MTDVARASLMSLARDGHITLIVVVFVRASCEAVSCDWRA